jgi:hypothetical protein
MLQHVISVSSPTGAVVDGHVSVDENETRWSFQPAKPWIAGNYRLLIEATLEDLAGNSIARPFEVHLPSGRPADVAEKVIPFQIPEAAAESRPRLESP